MNADSSAQLDCGNFFTTSAHAFAACRATNSATFIR